MTKEEIMIKCPSRQTKQAFYRYLIRIKLEGIAIGIALGAISVWLFYK